MNSLSFQLAQDIVNSGGAQLTGAVEPPAPVPPPPVQHLPPPVQHVPAPVQQAPVAPLLQHLPPLSSIYLPLSSIYLPLSSRCPQPSSRYQCSLGRRLCFRPLNWRSRFLHPSRHSRRLIHRHQCIVPIRARGRVRNIATSRFQPRAI
jgi:hypothetical protein